MAVITERGQIARRRRTTSRLGHGERWGLAGLLAATLIAYLWGLGSEGWANPYYSAAAQAGARDWEAFFFGSLDWNNSITVDKAPLAVWPMALAVRFFGLSPWSVLVPQAIAGMASVWVIYACIRRGFPVSVALSAAAIYAATPVVFLMSRYNNPEPVMGLFDLLGIYGAVRAIETGLWRWCCLFGLGFGLAFMAKGFQGLLWLPAAAVAVAVYSGGNLRTRLLRLATSAGIAAVSGTWWMIVVATLPSNSRPFIGSSQLNNPWDLALGYNGLARLVPSQINATQSAPYDGGFERMFNANFAQEIGWTLGPSILCLIVLTVFARELERPQQVIALLAGFALLATWIVLSFMADRIHTYYTYSLGAPAAIVLALGFYVALRAPTPWVRRVLPALIVGSTTYFAVRIMGYADGWSFWPLLVTILGTAAILLCIVPSGSSSGKESWRAGLLIVACTFLTVAPVATDAITASLPQVGGFPISGPTPRDSNAVAHVVDKLRAGDPDSLVVQQSGAPPSAVIQGKRPLALGSWLTATYPAQNAALYQLATGQPSLPIGGWSGTDPSMTLDRFQQLVGDYRISYFIGYAQLQPYFQNTEVGRIERWIDEHFRKSIADGIIVYDLHQPNS